MGIAKKCPSCGQPVGWLRFLWWCSVTTKSAKLHCPSCHTRLQLHSRISTILFICMAVALTMLRFFMPSIWDVFPLTLLFIPGLGPWIAEFVVMLIVVFILSNVFLVRVELRGDKARGGEHAQ